MKKILFAAVAVLLMAGCNMNEKKQTAAGDNDNETTLVMGQGEEAPDFTLKTPDDSTLTLSSLRGQYVVLDFWGTWCNPCIALVPELVKIHKSYPSLNLVSIAFENSMDDLPKLKQLIKQKDMDWTHVCQLRKGKDIPNVVSSFNVTSFPTTILIDSSGKILYRASGNDKTDSLKAKLREIYGKKPQR